MHVGFFFFNAPSPNIKHLVCLFVHRSHHLMRALFYASLVDDLDPSPSSHDPQREALLRSPAASRKPPGLAHLQIIGSSHFEAGPPTDPHSLDSRSRTLPPPQSLRGRKDPAEPRTLLRPWFRPSGLALQFCWPGGPPVMKIKREVR